MTSTCVVSPVGLQNPDGVHRVKGLGMPSSLTSEKMLWYCKRQAHLKLRNTWCFLGKARSECNKRQSMCAIRCHGSHLIPEAFDTCAQYVMVRASVQHRHARAEFTVVSLNVQCRKRYSQPARS